MKKVIDFLELVNEKAGKVVSWTSILLIIVISIDVILRYLFRFTYIWIVEIEVYLFGILFLLAAGYAFKHDKHVRVDVFYTKLSKKRKAIIDLIGGVLFLLPWCFIIIASSWKYAYSSFLIKESSAQAGGLPALYLLKFSIVIGFVLLSLQALVSVLKSINTIINAQK